MMEVTDTDDVLVARMAQRDEAALAELHRRYAPYLTAVARRLLRDPDEVQQTVQDAFVNAWIAADRFDPTRAAAKTWLVTITHRLAVNRLRGMKLETLPLETWDAPTKAPDLDARVSLERVIEHLEPDERALIEGAFYQGYSHGQLTERTGMPLGTVKTKLRSALGKLRTALKGGEA